jgi:cytochrome oxidase assembly protein ShyY1
MIEFVAYCVFAFLVILWLLCVLQQPRLSKKEEFMALLEVQIHEDPIAE